MPINCGHQMLRGLYQERPLPTIAAMATNGPRTLRARMRNIRNDPLLTLGTNGTSIVSPVRGIVKNFHKNVAGSSTENRRSFLWATGLAIAAGAVCFAAAHVG